MERLFPTRIGSAPLSETTQPVSLPSSRTRSITLNQSRDWISLFFRCYSNNLHEVLGHGRFFKSILCKYKEGLVLVKVYFKRGEPLDLKEYERKLFGIRNIFQSVQHPHVCPFQFWFETDEVAHLLRQHFFSNLHDRLSTRPFLEDMACLSDMFVDLTHLVVQLLCTVKQSHDKEVYHGDIKCENVSFPLGTGFSLQPLLLSSAHKY